MLTYLVNNRARRKMKVYLYRAQSGDDALAPASARRRSHEAGGDNWRTRRVVRMKIHWRPAQPFVALMY